MNKGYKVISEFCCCEKQMVIVRIGNTAHVMSQEEWHKVYKRNHQEKWKTNVHWDRFVPKKSYNVS